MDVCRDCENVFEWIDGSLSCRATEKIDPVSGNVVRTLCKYARGNNEHCKSFKRRDDAIIAAQQQ